MSSPSLQLRVLDDTSVSRELDLVSELFHRINRIIPENQELLTIPPETSVRDAIALLRKHGYSQLPVVTGGEVLGVFSYRSFAQQAAGSTWQEVAQQKWAPGGLAVEECLERFEFARVTEEMRQVFDAMDRDNGVLIGTPEKLQGILTPMDFLRYLYKVASPFVMISEIELINRRMPSGKRGRFRLPCLRLPTSRDFGKCSRPPCPRRCGTSDQMHRGWPRRCLENVERTR